MQSILTIKCAKCGAVLKDEEELTLPMDVELEPCEKCLQEDYDAGYADGEDAARAEEDDEDEDE